MKTLVILGAGQAGRAICSLLSPNGVEVLAFGDNDPKLWDYEAEIKVLPVKEALKLKPDTVLVGVLDAERTARLKEQLCDIGYEGEIMALCDLYASFDIRAATLKRLANRIEEAGVPGAVAELGVYRGDFARQLNGLFPHRRLYLFDTFEGFDGEDVKAEPGSAAARVKTHDFSDTGEEFVLSRMPYANQVTVKKGRFPHTSQGLEESFALVSIDVDLFAPTLAGLEYFYPRMSKGGVIMLHDYNSSRFDGVKMAAEKYEALHGRLSVIPLCDLHGTAVIIRP